MGLDTKTDWSVVNITLTLTLNNDYVAVVALDN
jgi:hypothetical protein